MNQQFEPMQKLISFVSDTPRLAWVARGYQFGHIIQIDGRLLLAVSHRKDEAEENLFSFVPFGKVKPYSDELWTACQEWINRRTQLGIDYEVLKRGRQPKATASKSVVPWQASLLEAA